MLHYSLIQNTSLSRNSILKAFCLPHFKFSIDFKEKKRLYSLMGFLLMFYMQVYRNKKNAA